MSARKRKRSAEGTSARARHVGVLARDTIVAVSTAPGRGAIAVVRLSGTAAERICRRVVSPGRGWPLVPRQATRCAIHACDDRHTPIDDGLVTVFPAPGSYTGETVVELGTHGGAYVPLAVCAALVEAGARAARPGEFTERAVLNGKLDLLRAEAIADLIEARSAAAHRMALRQLSGALSARLGALREAVLELEALLAYEIDFPEEDAGQLPRARVTASSEAVVAQLDALLATVPAAILGREGATVVLAGPPNAGKSSLLNALVGEARVIVSEAPGTTRDAVEVLVDHDPWPLLLVDTAGLQRARIPLERLGVEVSERYLGRAHAVIACAESVPGLAATAAAIATRTAAPIVGALTKRDLAPDSGVMVGARARSGAVQGLPFPVVAVSAVRGDGLEALRAQVMAALAGPAGTPDPDTPMVTRARHRSALTTARDEMLAFRKEWAAGALPAPVAATHVRAARTALDELIGVVDVQDVFARVFSTFCVGK